MAKTALSLLMGLYDGFSFLMVTLDITSSIK